MKIQIEITEEELKSLVIAHLENKLGDVSFKREEVKIETKSTQNYKSEWETAAFRARLEVNK